jgi:hypothetical protein
VISQIYGYNPVALNTTWPWRTAAVSRRHRESPVTAGIVTAAGLEVVRPGPLKQICVCPRIYVAERFARPREIASLLDLAHDRRALRRRGIEVQRRYPDRKDDTPRFHFELPVEEHDAALRALANRMHDAIRARRTHLSDVVFRYREYARGHHHRLHRDNFRIGTRSLVATMLLYLNDTEVGGETFFPYARPAPVLVHPGGDASRCGSIIGRTDRSTEGPRTRRQCRGTKSTLANFLCLPRRFARIAPVATMAIPNSRITVRL